MVMNRSHATRDVANIAKLPELLDTEPKADANPLIHRRAT
jgi:hypothetical protein